MKHEVYSCLKMLESLRGRVIDFHHIGAVDTYHDLTLEYIRIWELLKKYLTEDQLQFIPKINDLLDSFDTEKTQRYNYIRKLIATCDISISYLQSLEMDLDKELKEKEKELEYREKEITYMKNLLSKSLEAINKFPELKRSEIVEEIKKSHRGIEEYSKPNN